MLTTRLAVALALVACAPATAAAASPPGVQTRTFSVEIEGRQTTSFELDHAAAYQCDQGGHGSGSEVVAFRTGRPVRLTARLYGGRTVVFDHAGGVRAGARVTRKSSFSWDRLDPTCLGAGGDQQGAAPDCGTKHAAMNLTLGWWPKRSSGLTLQTGRARADVLFKNCPVNGKTFPFLLTSTSAGKQIVSQIPAADLFDAGFKKHILLGRGTFADHGAEGGYTTTVRWSVSLTARDEEGKR